MAIITDGVHLISDESLEELHHFARAMSLRMEWFQDDPINPHYDLTTKRALNRALARGAERVPPHELIRRLRLAFPRPARRGV